MNSKLQHIVEPSELLTQQEILDYMQKKDSFSQEQLFAIEKKINNNPINQEILEAYQEHPDLFKEFDIWGKRNNPLDSNSIEWILVFSSLILLSTMVYFWCTSNKDVYTKELEPEEHRVEITFVQNFERPKINAKVIESSSPKNSKSISQSDDKSFDRETVSVDVLESKTIDKIEPKEIAQKTLRNTKKYPSMYLGNYKVTDYRNIRYSTSTSEVLFTGVPASSENIEQPSSFEKLKKDSVYYIDFLEETLRGFQNKKYALVIPEFTKILKVYPSDDNALFYRGISYYYLSKSEKAIDDLEAVLSDSRSNFKQEAEWYMVLSYQKLGRIGECKLLLKKIIKAEDFYSKSAQELYKTME